MDRRAPMPRSKRMALAACVVLIVVGVPLMLYFVFAHRPPPPSPASDPLRPVPPLEPTPKPPAQPRRDIPSKARYEIHALAIGDWGKAKDSCCDRFITHNATDDEVYYKNYWAQRNVATLLAQSSLALHPKVIIGHGNNFLYVYIHHRCYFYAN